MYKAIQELKTTTAVKAVGFLLLAAVIGSKYVLKNDGTTSSDNTVDSVIVVKQEPQIEIQRQQVEPKETNLVTVKPKTRKTQKGKTESREKYIVRSGDNMHNLAKRLSPKDVKVEDYQSVLIAINSGHRLNVGQKLKLPSRKDLRNVILPDVEIKFSHVDEDFLNSLRYSEGSSKIQSKLNRRLLGGSYGAPYKNSKFYPYRDSNGNFTIGYGHYLGRDSVNAHKYRNGISKQEANVLLNKDVKRVMKDYIVLLQTKKATNLSEKQQKVLFEMAFTMGVDKLSSFHNMWKHLHNEKRFYSEIRNSLWYKQVGDRAERILSS